MKTPDPSPKKLSFIAGFQPLVKKTFSGTSSLVVALLLFAAGLSPAATTISLSTSWKFKTDPTNIGASQTQAWFSDTFDDSSWATIQSGKSWESQPAGAGYAGYAWYRQKVTIPASETGSPLTITLASVISDDDFYWNGQRIAGLWGQYKYENRKLRTYTIPANKIRYGASNTIAIRMWGGNLEFTGTNSGLVAGTYKMVLDKYQIMARAVGGTITSEKPVIGGGVAQNWGVWDFSTSQQGTPFEMVFRVDPVILGGVSANLAYTIKDFYGATIKTGTVSVATPSDGIPRGVVNIDSTASQAIYLAGRFKANWKVTDASTGATLFDNASAPVAVDHLHFYLRDETSLPALAATTESTPYGNLKLIDVIDCSTPLSNEVHPYMQSSFTNHAQDKMTPGVKVNVPIKSILGKQAREPEYGWFAYRIGRGNLVPGNSYLLRIEYPEDKPRYCPVEVQVGQNYMDVGWKNGISSTDVYDPWPLSNAWQYYDVIVPVGDETTAAGGTGDGNAQRGFWIYFMNKMKPGYYFKLYSGGPAIATIKLYEISAAVNSPAVTLPPAGIPRRVMTLDWERQPTSIPSDIVDYAKLMGYNAISPLTLKWAFANYADPAAGYDSLNVDLANYWVTSKYTAGSGTAPAPAVPGVKSVHQLYLAATKAAGIDYIPRFEYGGGYDLPAAARAIGADGTTAKPNRFATWGANLLDTATYNDMKAFLDSLIKPYAATNPQLRGALWRIRSDRMQISYGKADGELFSAETGTPLPSGWSTMTAAQRAAWAATTVRVAYTDWWHGKRRDFHQQLVSLVKSYRSDMTLYYYNWDNDKFSMKLPDLNSSAFYGLFSSTTAATTAYNNDRTARAGYTAADYINVMTTGDFKAALPSVTRPETSNLWPDYGLRPSLYSGVSGIQLLAPANYFCYANLPDYLNYFKTADGLAVSNCVSYDEVASRMPNPKYEGSMVLPGGAPFSMAMELLAWYHGDARTLTYTVYTYGRGFAGAHRSFAQAFRALPAVPGTVVAGTPADTMVRTYSTTNGTYVGAACKSLTPKTFTVKVPGAAGKAVTNLVTGAAVPASNSGADLTFSLASGPMELNAFLVK